MESNNIDKLFREKLEQKEVLPENVKWNPESGWDEYQKQFFKQKKSAKKFLIYSCSAAAVLITLFLVFKNNMDQNKLTTIVNNSTKPKEVKLPCGNIVWLNKESSVKFPTKINSSQYKIDIQGEAFVNIQDLKSTLYIIKSQNAIVKLDVPSSFDIRNFSDDESIDITVNSGVIKVTETDNDGGTALLVTKGNYCSVLKSQKLIFATKNENPNFLAWKTGHFVFNNTSMETVTEVLSQYYKTDIELLDYDIAYCRFSGTFTVDNMDLILNQIKSDLKLEIINAGKIITISGQGCI